MELKDIMNEVTSEKVWEIADVRNIPDGWYVDVYYDSKKKKLCRTDSYTGGTDIQYGPNEIYLDTFISLGEFWNNYPANAEELGIDPENEKEEEEILLDLYREEWEEDFPNIIDRRIEEKKADEMCWGKKREGEIEDDEDEEEREEDEDER